MTALTLARPDDLDRLLPLVAAFHADQGIDRDDDARRRAAVLPLLEGSPHGAIYLAGPRRAPIGYLILSFGWSVKRGGLEGVIDQFFIRPGVRGRGIGSEILNALPNALAGAGLKALHLEVARNDARARALCERMRFEPREPYLRMTRLL